MTSIILSKFSLISSLVIAKTSGNIKVKITTKIVYSNPDIKNSQIADSKDTTIVEI